MQLITLVGIVATTMVGLTTIAGFIIKVCSPIRNWFNEKIQKIARNEAKTQDEEISKKIFENFEEIKNQMKNIEDKLQKVCGGSREQLKNSIKDIYYKNLPDEIIEADEKEILIELFSFYKELGGNHVIDEFYRTMMKWKVI